MAARVAIVGGGVSGLATAYYLKRLGINSVLFEKSNRLGGLIQTDVVDGCQLEAGPDSYLSAKPAVTELAAELDGLKNAVIGSNDAQRRVFVVRRGRLVPFPNGMKMVVPGEWMPALRSRLFGWRTKMRFVSETFTRPRGRETDVSVGEFVNRHFGDEVLEYVADPLLAGVYGGDAADLSAASVLPRFVNYEERYGSLIRGVRREERSAKAVLFRSLREGMQSLTDALAGAIADATEIVHEEVISVSQTEAGWVLRTDNRRLSSEQLVLACPAHVAAKLLASDQPGLADELAAIPYRSSLLVTLLYERAECRHALAGFGFLVPKRERGTIAAATWINTKFPSRVRGGLVAIRAFIVADEADRLLTASDDALTELVVADVRRFMPGLGKPGSALVRRWPLSMPQYVVGHQARQQKIADLVRRLCSLHLVGNAYDGVGIPDCVRLAKQTAQQLATIKTC